MWTQRKSLCARQRCPSPGETGTYQPGGLGTYQPGEQILSARGIRYLSARGTGTYQPGVQVLSAKGNRYLSAMGNRYLSARGMEQKSYKCLRFFAVECSHPIIQSSDNNVLLTFSRIQKSKTYSGLSPFQGLSNGTTLI